MTEFPTGTVTFLFTDIVRGTQLSDRHHDAMRTAMEAHDGIMRRVIGAHGGVLVKQTGDGTFAAFGSAVDAVRAAAAIQMTIDAHDWGSLPEFSVRVGAHTGEAESRHRE